MARYGQAAMVKQACLREGRTANEMGLLNDTVRRMLFACSDGSTGGEIKAPLGREWRPKTHKCVAFQIERG